MWSLTKFYSIIMTASDTEINKSFEWTIPDSKLGKSIIEIQQVKKLTEDIMYHSKLPICSVLSSRGSLEVHALSNSVCRKLSPEEKKIKG
jgi:hypothetical protein